ncbi:unnamed protein product, partial [Discosporangium mesarthrocarpum]
TTSLCLFVFFFPPPSVSLCFFFHHQVFLLVCGLMHILRCTSSKIFQAPSPELSAHPTHTALLHTLLSLPITICLSAVMFFLPVPFSLPLEKSADITQASFPPIFEKFLGVINMLNFDL